MNWFLFTLGLIYLTAQTQAQFFNWFSSSSSSPSTSSSSIPVSYNQQVVDPFTDQSYGFDVVGPEYGKSVSYNPYIPQTSHVYSYSDSFSPSSQPFLTEAYSPIGRIKDNPDSTGWNLLASGSSLFSRDSSNSEQPLSGYQYGYGIPVSSRGAISKTSGSAYGTPSQQPKEKYKTYSELFSNTGENVFLRTTASPLDILRVPTVDTYTGTSSGSKRIVSPKKSNVKITQSISSKISLPQRNNKVQWEIANEPTRLEASGDKFENDQNKKAVRKSVGSNNVERENNSHLGEVIQSNERNYLKPPSAISTTTVKYSASNETSDPSTDADRKELREGISSTNISTNPEDAGGFVISVNDEEIEIVSNETHTQNTPNLFRIPTVSIENPTVNEEYNETSTPNPIKKNAILIPTTTTTSHFLGFRISTNNTVEVSDIENDNSVQDHIFRPGNNLEVEQKNTTEGDKNEPSTEEYKSLDDYQGNIGDSVYFDSIKEEFDYETSTIINNNVLDETIVELSTESTESNDSHETTDGVFYLYSEEGIAINFEGDGQFDKARSNLIEEEDNKDGTDNISELYITSLEINMDNVTNVNSESFEKEISDGDLKYNAEFAGSFESESYEKTTETFETTFESYETISESFETTAYETTSMSDEITTEPDKTTYDYYETTLESFETSTETYETTSENNIISESRIDNTENDKDKELRSEVRAYVDKTVNEKATILSTGETIKQNKLYGDFQTGMERTFSSILKSEGNEIMKGTGTAESISNKEIEINEQPRLESYQSSEPEIELMSTGLSLSRDNISFANPTSSTDNDRLVDVDNTEQVIELQRSSKLSEKSLNLDGDSSSGFKNNKQRENQPRSIFAYFDNNQYLIPGQLTKKKDKNKGEDVNADESLMEPISVNVLRKATQFPVYLQQQSQESIKIQGKTDETPKPIYSGKTVISSIPQSSDTTKHINPTHRDIQYFSNMLFLPFKTEKVFNSANGQVVPADNFMIQNVNKDKNLLQNGNLKELQILDFSIGHKPFLPHFKSNLDRLNKPSLLSSEFEDDLPLRYKTENDSPQEIESDEEKKIVETPLNKDDISALPLGGFEQSRSSGPNSLAPGPERSHRVGLPNTGGRGRFPTAFRLPARRPHGTHVHTPAAHHRQNPRRTQPDPARHRGQPVAGKRRDTLPDFLRSVVTRPTGTMVLSPIVGGYARVNANFG